MAAYSSKSTAIGNWDQEQSRSFLVKQQRMRLAWEAVERGWTGRQYVEACRAYAMHAQDDHRSWYFSEAYARKLMEAARKEMGRELAKSRATEYAKHQRRLERLYARAVERDDDEMALQISRMQIELSNNAHSVILGEQQAKPTFRENRRLDAAISDLTEALASTGNKESAGDAGSPDRNEAGH